MKTIQDGDGSVTKENQVRKAEEINVADDWSEDCLEFFYDNKMFFPGIVSAKKFTFILL